MRTYLPYTVIQPATAISLNPYDYTPVLLDGPDAYRLYFVERWVEGQTFINVEHDVVVWPGALDDLDRCAGRWCAFGYSVNDDFADHDRSGFPYLGCVKFSAEVIARTPGAWDGADDWLTLDRHIARVIRSTGLDVCQHRPGVVNANPVLLRGA